MSVRHYITLDGERFTEQRVGEAYYLWYEVNGYKHLYESAPSIHGMVVVLTAYGNHRGCYSSTYFGNEYSQRYSHYEYKPAFLWDEHELVEKFPEVERLEEMQGLLWGFVESSLARCLGPYEYFKEWQ